MKPKSKKRTTPSDINKFFIHCLVSTQWEDPSLKAANRMLKSIPSVKPLIPEILEKFDEILNSHKVFPIDLTPVCYLYGFLKQQSNLDFEPPDDPFYRTTQFTDSQIRYKTRD